MGKDKVYVHVGAVCTIIKVDRSKPTIMTVGAVVRRALVKQQRKASKAGTLPAVPPLAAFVVKDAGRNVLESGAMLPEGSGFDLFVDRADTGVGAGGVGDAAVVAAAAAAAAPAPAAPAVPSTRAPARSTESAKPKAAKTATKSWDHRQATTLLQQKQVRAAIRSAEEALEKGKQPAWAAHEILARAFLRLGRNEEALDQAGKLGDCGLMESGKLRVSVLQRASECAGRALLAMGKYQNALTELQGGLRVTPDEDERQCLVFQLLIGRVFRGAGKTTMAYQIFYGIVSSMEDAEGKGTGRFALLICPATATLLETHASRPLPLPLSSSQLPQETPALTSGPSPCSRKF